MADVVTAAGNIVTERIVPPATVFTVPAGTEMTMDLLQDLIGKHKTEVQHRLSKFNDAYLNRYEIYRQANKAAYKPDNRLSVNYAKYIVDTMTGFFAGIPVAVTSSEENVAEFLQAFNARNGLEDDLSELAKEASIFGTVVQMIYTDEEARICIQPVSAMESFMVYDTSILQRPMFFIRYYKDEDGKEVGSWSDSRVVQHFAESAGGYRAVDEAKLHGFDGVPAVEFIDNEERMSLFESVLPLINAYNKVISEKANDVDYFADAYLKILGAKLNDNEIQNLRDNRIINFEGDFDKLPEVEFLQKPEADATQEHLLDRLQQMIFETSMVADINDINFGTASGIAIKYRLWAMSSLAKTKERKFTRSLQNMYRLVFSSPLMPAGIPEDSWATIDYIFQLNYPANLLEETEIAKNLAGIVSKETQMAVLSIIGDPAAEMEKIEEEQASQMADLFPLATE